jgi:hypothetical protein
MVKHEDGRARVRETVCEETVERLHVGVRVRVKALGTHGPSHRVNNGEVIASRVEEASELHRMTRERSRSLILELMARVEVVDSAPPFVLDDSHGLETFHELVSVRLVIEPEDSSSVLEDLKGDEYRHPCLA